MPFLLPVDKPPLSRILANQLVKLHADSLVKYHAYSQKTISGKTAGEVKPKRLMFAPIVFNSFEEATAAGFVPEKALTDEDVKGCEAVFEDDESE